MAVHRYRVRRHTKDRLEVCAFFPTIGKAQAYATRRVRETGSVHRIEHHPPLKKGWEVACELAPDLPTEIERLIARGKLPKVQNADGRKGRVLSYIRPTRQVRVAWLDVEKPGKGEVVPVDELSLR